MDQTVKVAEAKAEDRVSEKAISAFQHLGYSGRLPDGLVEVYSNFKRAKDKFQPGPLTPEGYATVVTLYNLVK